MGSGSDQREHGGDATPVPAWRRAFAQLFDPHPSHVALLDLDGTVLAVNAAWTRYGQTNSLSAGYGFVGRNYLAVCEAAVARNYPAAREAYLGLLGVLRNDRPKFTLVYPCHTPVRREWYRMWVEPQTPSVPAVIVAHQLVVAKPLSTDASDGVDLHPSAGSGGLDSRPAFPA